MLGGDRRLAIRDLLGALDARLDDVEMGDAQAIELLRHDRAGILVCALVGPVLQ
jgi:hypothetical protein